MSHARKVRCTALALTTAAAAKAATALPDTPGYILPVYDDAADQIDAKPTSISTPVQWG